MKQPIVFLSTLATLSTFSALAFAHGGGGRMFERLDQNRDGKITQQEADAVAKAHFTELDKNKDGVISGAELEGRGRVRHADANGDGKVTLAEMTAKKKELFTRFDKNKDGVLTRDEMPAKHGRGQGRGHGGGRGPCGDK
jgi:hypothetical protein